MSLKTLHIVFITSAILLALGFGAFEIHRWRELGAGSEELGIGIGSLVAGVLLACYGVVFLRKTRHISYL